jgi:hypothetical protein
MRLEYALIAEGIGQDARGAFTLIAVDQVIVVAPTLPTPVSRVLAIRGIEEAHEFENATVTMQLTVLSPSGETISATSGMGPLGPRLFDDVPGMFNANSIFSFLAAEYGRYEVRASVATSTGSELTVSSAIYIRPAVPDPSMAKSS